MTERIDLTPKAEELEAKKKWINEITLNYKNSEQ
jgi:hypothetical protein